MENSLEYLCQNTVFEKDDSGYKSIEKQATFIKYRLFSKFSKNTSLLGKKIQHK